MGGLNLKWDRKVEEPQTTFGSILAQACGIRPVILPVVDAFGELRKGAGADIVDYFRELGPTVHGMIMDLPYGAEKES